MAGLPACAVRWQLTPAEIVQEVTESGLRGRGGAGFPTGIKWKTVLEAAGPQKYIVCNADEGDSGTFADRMIMEGDPFVLIEGMAIAGIATGATKGYRLYALGISAARSPPWKRRWRLPASTTSSGASRARLGLMPSTWKSASARAPMSAARRRRCSTAWKASAAWFAPSRRCRRIQGLFGKPTVINNVISLASVPVIMEKGAQYYRDFGMGRSRGTIPIQIAGNVKPWRPVRGGVRPDAG